MSPRPPHKLIVAIGDSTTAGSPGFLSPLEAPPDGSGDITSQFAYWLMRERPDWRVLNRGVNGERSDQIRARFRRDAIDARPDLIVIIAGVNDIYQGRRPERIQQELDAMFEEARAAPPRGIPIVAGSVLPYNTASSLHNERMHALNDWIRARATDRAGIAFCDTRAAVADPERPDCLRSSPDGLHPSADGYRLMAAALEVVVAQVLARSTRS
jgi:lysophospholipase L1-like esterase